MGACLTEPPLPSSLGTLHSARAASRRRRPCGRRRDVARLILLPIARRRGAIRCAAPRAGLAHAPQPLRVSGSSQRSLPTTLPTTSARGSCRAWRPPSLRCTRHSRISSSPSTAARQTTTSGQCSSSSPLSRACGWARASCAWRARRSSALDLAPHLHAVPADLHCFGALLHRLGVRASVQAEQYLQLLDELAAEAAGASLPPSSLQTALAIAQQLASPQHQPLPQAAVHLPDASGVLAPAHQLIFDDARLAPEAAAARRAVGGAAGARSEPAATRPPG